MHFPSTVFELTFIPLLNNEEILRLLHTDLPALLPHLAQQFISLSHLLPHTRHHSLFSVMLVERSLKSFISITYAFGIDLDEKSQFPIIASVTISIRLILVRCGAICACASRTSRRSRTVRVADKFEDRPRLFLGFAFRVASVGVAGVRVDGVKVGVWVGVRVSAGGEVEVMAAHWGSGGGRGRSADGARIHCAGLGNWFGECQWRLRR